MVVGSMNERLTLEELMRLCYVSGLEGYDNKVGPSEWWDRHGKDRHDDYEHWETYGESRHEYDDDEEDSGRFSDHE